MEILNELEVEWKGNASFSIEIVVVLEREEEIIKMAAKLHYIIGDGCDYWMGDGEGYGYGHSDGHGNGFGNGFGSRNGSHSQTEDDFNNYGSGCGRGDGYGNSLGGGDG